MVHITGLIKVMFASSGNLITRLINAPNIAYQYGMLLFRSLPLLWTAAPKETTLLAITLLLQGVIPSVSIWINKQVVDSVAVTVGSGKDYNFSTLITLVSSWVIAIFLESFIPPWGEAAFRNINEKLTANINLLLIDKANSFSDL
ncbi:MAG: hypothetical protein ACYT04_37670, partial [Nostoc sp.]